MLREILQSTSVAAAILFLTNCSGAGTEADSNQKTAEEIILKADSSYADIAFRRNVLYTDSLLLDDIQDVAVNEAGVVFLAGEKWNHLELHTFTSDGKYLGSIGQIGTEPGSFQEVERIQFSGSDVWVSDTQLNRMTRFEASTGNVLETISLDSLYSLIDVNDNQGFSTIDPVGIAGPSDVLVSLAGERNPIYQPEFKLKYALLNRAKEDSLRVKSLFEGQARRYVVGDYAGRPVAFSLAINERPLIDIKQEGPIYAVNSSEFTIRVFSQDGTLIRIYQFPYERLRLNPAEEVFPDYTYNRQLLMVRESADYPDYWPALYDMFLDDEERLWVSTVMRDRSKSEWFIIDDKEKKIAASFTWPTEKHIWDVRNGHVYTVESDSAGFKTVVSYEFEINP